MAYVLRLIAGATLSLFVSVAFADFDWNFEFNTSPSQVCNTYETMILPYDPGKNSICSSGCRMNYHDYFNGYYVYQGIGETCDIWDGNPFPPDPNGYPVKECPAYDLKSSNKKFSSEKVCMEGCAYDFISQDSVNSEYFVYEGKGASCGPGTDNSEYSYNIGNYETDETKKFEGMPAGFTICGDNLNYLHDCYKYDEENEEWRYWYRNDDGGLCDESKDKETWHKCYFDGKYYRKMRINRTPNSEPEKTKEYDSYFDFKKAQCEENYIQWDDTSGFEDVLVCDENFDCHWESKWVPSGYADTVENIEYAAAKQYCANRFRSNEEDNLYEHAVADTVNEASVTETLSGNSTIDIKKLFGISNDEDSSLSSAVPDLLSDSFTAKSGEFGTCLSDLEIMVFGYELTLPISHVCSWLEYIGTIFVFLSLISAVHIVVKG